MADTLLVATVPHADVFDEGVREILAIEVDSSLPAERVIRAARSAPEPAAAGANPGSIQPELTRRTRGLVRKTHRVKLHHIQPGNPTSELYRSASNRTLRTKSRRSPFQPALRKCVISSRLDDRPTTKSARTTPLETPRPHSSASNKPNPKPTHPTPIL